MTDLRAAAQQALEFIRAMNSHGWLLADYESDMERTVAGLEAALVQEQAEPVAMRYGYDGYGYQYIDSGSGSDWRTRIKDAEPLCVAPLKAVPYAAQSAYWAASDRIQIDPVTGSVSIGAVQAEPVQEPSSDFDRGFQRGWRRAMRDRDRDFAMRARVEERLAALVQEQAEPVAGVVLNEEGRAALVEHGREEWHCAARNARRLYTAPPQRLPLTEEEAAALIELDPRMLKEFGTAPSGAAMELIRRTERAHGIGGQDE